MTAFRRFLREPLVHFLVLGAALFLGYAWSGGGAGPGSNRIVLTAGQIEYLASNFERVWQRPPTDAELKGLVDDWVREEIATREAIELGLDRDDIVLRRRLRQKLEFLAEDAVGAAPPSDAELEGWLTAHAEAYRTLPRIAFRQIYFRDDERGNDADIEARRLLAELDRLGGRAPVEQFGDRSTLPPELPLSDLREISAQFGDSFADAVVALEIGRWSGPVRSGFGLHLVFVTEKTESRLPGLDEIRSVIERDLMADRRQKELAALYEGLLKKYTVIVERREPSRDTP